MIFKPMVRITVPILSLLLAFSILAFQHIDHVEQSNEKQIQNGVNVVELFTSQGCSSCPPADALLAQIKDDENVIALSYHVDYWNYLGWKDPYSDKAYSAYQRSYAKELNSGVYTPQMVVNGSKEFVGSRESTLKSSINKKSMVTALNAPVIVKGSKSIDFTYSMDGAKKYDKAYALLLIDDETTAVAKGENARKKLRNTNVVIQRVELDKKASNGKQSFKVDVNNKTNYKVAIIAQDKDLAVVAAGISTLE
ncbi:Protein of unknown function [Nonlabens sp. Hel1_33_55]|uniref:DUF1223 domain-containing protein n=1 Tax=Nonlabens sp. Hel1_33_55 TaxID=1336802 RepID=UPI000875DCDE|nr:DUF1223 domain-containing protein [Nonlabens sp. Hel1_33_55]SCY12827.1 Protein of unknown function [Nonlabens sp. Hel1_33_55]